MPVPSTAASWGPVLEQRASDARQHPIDQGQDLGPIRESLQRVEARDFAQADRLAHRGHEDQHLLDPAVGASQWTLKDDAGKELRLGELVRTLLCE
jgi:hypothetical protein